MKTELQFPFYAKAAQIVIGLFVFVSMLSIAQSIIVPLIYSTIIAILLSPIVGFLVKKRINRLVAIALTVVVVLLIAISLTILLSAQLVNFSDALPNLIEKFHTMIDQFVVWISNTFNISIVQLNSWIELQNTQLIESASSGAGQTIVNTGSKLIVVVLVPIYIFMLLYYQPLLLQFIHRLFSSDNQTNVSEVISSTKKIIQTYLVGLLFEALIIAVLYSIALFILGIQYALLLAVIGAILNLIPYLGAIIAAALPMIVALATQSPTIAFLVLGSYILIQLVDNNFIIPKVVASRVRINALVSIIVVIAGGALWGIPGMFLAIPLTAILKVIFDHIDGLKPWGYVLGDFIPTVSKPFFKKQVKKNIEEI